VYSRLDTRQDGSYSKRPSPHGAWEGAGSERGCGFASSFAQGHPDWRRHWHRQRKGYRRCKSPVFAHIADDRHGSRDMPPTTSLSSYAPLRTQLLCGCQRKWCGKQRCDGLAIGLGSQGCCLELLATGRRHCAG